MLVIILIRRFIMVPSFSDQSSFFDEPISKKSKGISFFDEKTKKTCDVLAKIQPGDKIAVGKNKTISISGESLGYFGKTWQQGSAKVFRYITGDSIDFTLKSLDILAKEINTDKENALNSITADNALDVMKELRSLKAYIKTVEQGLVNLCATYQNSEEKYLKLKSKIEIVDRSLTDFYNEIVEKSFETRIKLGSDKLIEQEMKDKVEIGELEEKKPVSTSNLKEDKVWDEYDSNRKVNESIILHQKKSELLKGIESKLGPKEDLLREVPSLDTEGDNREQSIANLRFENKLLHERNNQIRKEVGESELEIIEHISESYSEEDEVEIDEKDLKAMERIDQEIKEEMLKYEDDRKLEYDRLSLENKNLREENQRLRDKFNK